jgi:hypothetical protein
VYATALSEGARLQGNAHLGELSAGVIYLLAGARWASGFVSGLTALVVAGVVRSASGGACDHAVARRK